MASPSPWRSSPSRSRSSAIAAASERRSFTDVGEPDGLLRAVPEPDRLRIDFVDALRRFAGHDRAVRRTRVLHHRRRALLQVLLRLHRDVEAADLAAPPDVVEGSLARFPDPVRLDELAEPPGALRLHPRLGLLRGLLLPLLRQLRLPRRERLAALALLLAHLLLAVAMLLRGILPLLPGRLLRLFLGDQAGLQQLVAEVLHAREAYNVKKPPWT